MSPPPYVDFEITPAPDELELAEVQRLVDRVRWVHPVARPAEPTLIGYVTNEEVTT